MSIPTQWATMVPILRILGNGKVISNSEYVGLVAEDMQLTEEDMSEVYADGNNKVAHASYWGKFHLEKAGLICFPTRGYMQITEEGLKVLKNNIKMLCKKDLMEYDAYRTYDAQRGRKKIKKTDEEDNTYVEIDETLSPKQKFEEGIKEINNIMREDILSYIHNNSPFFFEKMVLDLLVSMGYGGSRIEASQATKKSGDEGIDGIINEDRLGLDRIYIQAKRWKDTTVGRPEIQKFVGALAGQGATKGVFITTSTFSKEAIEYANNAGNVRIVLIDGEQLAQYMIEFNIGVSIESTYEVKRIDTDYFIEG